MDIKGFSSFLPVVSRCQQGGGESLDEKKHTQSRKHQADDRHLPVEEEGQGQVPGRSREAQENSDAGEAPGAFGLASIAGIHLPARIRPKFLPARQNTPIPRGNPSSAVNNEQRDKAPHNKLTPASR